MPATDGILEQLGPLLSAQYRFERELGRGGMGVVYLARELRLDRLVAVKVLPPHLGSQPTIRERFLREARTAAQLSHPNIVPIYRAEEIDGFAYFAMAYIEGENLAERVRDRGPLPSAEVVRVLREAAWALAYAHARGVVHRDIKAANIMIERGSGRAVVTDFGIARDTEAASITGSGEVVGTVHYMSPEQANGQPLDGRSDLYSLGVAGFFALSGRLPFEGDHPAAVLVSVAAREAPSLGEIAPSVPRPLVEVIDRCLRKDPSDRYSTGEALADALTQALERASREAAAQVPDQIVPTGRAQAIWLRAAQLQAEAATRLEQRSRETTGLTGLTAELPSGGYRLRDVEAAAREVGISPEFVALALAEQPAGAAPPVSLSGGWKDRAATTLLGVGERSLSASRVIRASPKVVLEAIGRVFPARPYIMTFKDTVGGHPLDGGVLVFSVPNMRDTGVVAGKANLTPFTYRMFQLELFRLNVTLRPVAGSSGPGCEVTVYGDLRPGIRRNLIADQVIAGSMAGGGAAAGTAVGLAALQLGALAALTGAGGALLLGGAGLLWYRLIFRNALRKSGEELSGLLEAVETSLRSQQVFGSTHQEEP
jgi:predicted Ser/Thr protein kinase